MARPTLQDIARLAGTSAATVSRVLSESGYPVSEDLRQRIHMAAGQLDYVPNLVGRMLKTRDIREIGVIVPTISNPFYARLLLGIETEARRQGYHVLFCDSFRDVRTENAYIRTMMQKQVQGLVIASINQDHHTLDKAQRQGLHIVTLDQNVDSLACHKVGFDFFKAGMMAANHLADLGHRKVAFLTTPLIRRSRREQLEGCRLALLKHQVSLPDSHVLEAQDEEEQESMLYEFTAGRLLAGSLLALDPVPTAVIAVNDLVAMSVVQCLIRQGIRVPQDISVIGFDNLEFSEMVTPALTTIEQPALETGRLACQVLLGQVEQGTALAGQADSGRILGPSASPVTLTLEPRLVIRQSTGPAPAAG